METSNDKNLTSQGFDETNEYTPPKMSDDVTAEDIATQEKQEKEKGNEDVEEQRDDLLDHSNDAPNAANDEEEEDVEDEYDKVASEKDII